AANRVYELLTARNRVRGPRRRELIAQADVQFQVEARKLSRMLLSPVAAKLTGKRLLIAPQGALQFLPFAALPSTEAEGQGDKETEQIRNPESGIRNPESYTPLIADHEVIVVPSASALAAIARQTAMRKPAESSVIVFVDPVFSRA